MTPKEKMQIEEAIDILEKTYIIAARRSGKIQNVKALALAINALRENAYIKSSSSYKELQALRQFKKDNERPTGEWIKADIITFGSGYDWIYKCSVCNFHSKGETNYCPNCGAKMKGEEE